MTCLICGICSSRTAGEASSPRHFSKCTRRSVGIEYMSLFPEQEIEYRSRGSRNPIETHERSIPRLINAVTVALNLVPTSTYTSLTCSSLAFPMLHLQRQSCNCFVVSRRAATVSWTLDPIYIFKRVRSKKKEPCFASDKQYWIHLRWRH